MIYDSLLQEAAQLGIDIYEKPMSPRNKGLYCDNVIWINKCLATRAERACAASEEIGHQQTSFGDILDLSGICARKQELRARQWGYKRLVPLSAIVRAYHARVSDRYAVAEFLGVTEEFLQDSIDWYYSKYGIYTTWNNYIIYFSPLGVVEMFE